MSLSADPTNFFNFIDFKKEIRKKKEILYSSLNETDTFELASRCVLFLNAIYLKKLSKQGLFRLPLLKETFAEFLENFIGEEEVCISEDDIKKILLIKYATCLNKKYSTNRKLIHVLNVLKNPLQSHIKTLIKKNDEDAIIKHSHYYREFYGEDVFLSSLRKKQKIPPSRSEKEILSKPVYMELLHALLCGDAEDKNKKMPEEFLDMHEKLLNNFEVNIGRRHPETSIIFQEKDSLQEQLIIPYLILSWTQLACILDDVRYFNGALKLLGFFARLNTQNKQLLFLDILCLCVAYAHIQHIKSKKWIYGKRITPHATNTAEAYLPISRTSPNIILLVSAHSSTFPPLWDEMKKANIYPKTIILINDSNATPTDIYAQPWYPSWSLSLRKLRTQPKNFNFKNVHNINICTLDSINSIEGRELLQRLQPDLVVLVSMGVISQATLSSVDAKFINAHNGILPLYRGMDAIAWAVFHNDILGCSLHFVDKGIDTGPIIRVEKIENEHWGDVKDKTKYLQARLITDALRHAVKNNNLPFMCAQKREQGKQYYRMHPELRMICNERTKEEYRS